MNGDATAKRCDGDGRALNEMMGLKHPHRPEGMQRGTRQRVPFAKIGVVVQHTSCGARISDIYLRFRSREGAMSLPTYAVFAAFMRDISDLIYMDRHVWSLTSEPR